MLGIAICLLTLAACVCAFAANDDAEMVLVPAGTFVLGDQARDIDEDSAEAPEQKLDLPAFYIDKYEVTNVQYARFLNAVGRLQDDAGHGFVWAGPYFQIEQSGGQWRPKTGLEKYPVVCVTWYGATAYAAWVGKRLPTEAEWEKAARGTDGRKFPWGADMDMSRFHLGCDDMLPVGSFPTGASPYGCLDMSGNAWEWTSSLFRPYPYVATDGREDPRSDERRVARGGSFAGEPYIAHSAYRFRPEPDYAHRFLGFRCAKSAP
jgi:formylglycine-generating enzyme required for sulfatase activity